MKISIMQRNINIVSEILSYDKTSPIHCCLQKPIGISEKSKTKTLAKKVNGFKLLTISTNSSIRDTWLGSEYPLVYITFKPHGTMVLSAWIQQFSRYSGSERLVLSINVVESFPKNPLCPERWKYLKICSWEQG